MRKVDRERPALGAPPRGGLVGAPAVTADEEAVLAAVFTRHALGRGGAAEAAHGLRLAVAEHARLAGRQPRERADVAGADATDRAARFPERDAIGREVALAV